MLLCGDAPRTVRVSTIEVYGWGEVGDGMDGRVRTRGGAMRDVREDEQANQESCDLCLVMSTSGLRFANVLLRTRNTRLRKTI